jgi:hypothetical protein
MLTIDIMAGVNIYQAARQAVTVAATTNRRVKFVFNDTEVQVNVDDTEKVVVDRYYALRGQS